ncbi:hypothetical protein [Microbacterium excoecariae]|uniref:hypothetical protein n=1 Tax=Microbacterium excoecariae TaxID=2715210 RepID=UPI00140C2BC6|nr:hypothetical protein [Microbacterium excoecariae]NHI17261.1 hypothetical protein [Microbacterium excoecariae]
MTDFTSHRAQVQIFISTSAHHRPRIRRSAILVLLGVPLLVLGIYLVVNDLPEMTVRKAEIWFSAGPLILGAVGLVFGAYGLVTSIPAAMRTGDDAIDLELGQDGVIVRGGHVIPWAMIKGATAVQYINSAKAQLLWDGKHLNRALVLRVKEPRDVPGAASKDGKHTVRIRLQHYAAAEYQKLFVQVVAKLRSNGIQVVEDKKHKQT